ncbi:MAG: hypothetical protein M1831_002364 [Alyxoria varia]|nr:MAG: hypothetical protein M1831_002364 [Alyxoria varia]
MSRHLSRCRVAQSLPRCTPTPSISKRPIFRTARLSWSPAPLEEWVERESRPVSLRQLTVFGRTLTEARLVNSANYVRTEIPTRLAHRLRDLQTLPYVVITNPHMNHVYNLYEQGFDRFRRIPDIKTVEDNNILCKEVHRSLREHLSVIPRLIMGVLETRHLVSSEKIDGLLNTLLKSRISRRVICEQHLALTETFHSPWHFPDFKTPESHTEFIGEVFLRCNAKSAVEHCAATVESLCRQTYGADVQLPRVSVRGHTEATLVYIPSHLEYIIGELLRNSFQAVIEQRRYTNGKPPPIEVLICEAPQHVIFRVSDQGGGIPHNVLPHLWSFVKGSRQETRLENLNKVPQLAATLQEVKVPESEQLARDETSESEGHGFKLPDANSLSSLTSRPPNLRLGIGLPMSRVYAEYWAGNLEIHSLEGYGVDAFLQVSKLGNKNEQLSTRATMDAL